jgi:hypothetical protein
MKLLSFFRKSISMFVMVAFTFLICCWGIQSPAAPLASTAEKSSVASASGDAEETTGHFEKEEPGPGVKKMKKIPWLIIGAAVVVSATLVYFLVIKKPKYTLTVNVGANCNGSPAANTKYSKGTEVQYSYTSISGFSAPEVKLDGVVVPASGTITMNADHALAVTTEPMYTLNVSLGTGCTGYPATGITYKKDSQVNYNYTLLEGYTGLQVMLDGVVVPASGTVIMDKSKSLTITAAPDIRGAWWLTYSTMYLGDFSFEIVFSGTPSSGTCVISNENIYGTYNVVGEQAAFDLNVYRDTTIKHPSAMASVLQKMLTAFRPFAPWAFRGNLLSGILMSGTYDFPDGSGSGHWIAVRRGYE